MSRFIKSADRFQSILFPETLDDYIEEENSVRIIEAFIEGLDFSQLGFQKTKPHTTGRPSYDPAILLKIYVYGYLDQNGISHFENLWKCR